MRAVYRVRIGIPNRIEEYKDRFDLVPRSDSEELIEATLKTFGVLLPKQVVKIDAHRIHAQTLGPPEFKIDPLRVERVSLPHLQLVNGARGVVVAAD